MRIGRKYLAIALITPLSLIALFIFYISNFGAKIPCVLELAHSLKKSNQLQFVVPIMFEPQLVLSLPETNNHRSTPPTLFEALYDREPSSDCKETLILIRVTESGIPVLVHKVKASTRCSMTWLFEPHSDGFSLTQNLDLEPVLKLSHTYTLNCEILGPVPPNASLWLWGRSSVHEIKRSTLLCARYHRY